MRAVVQRVRRAVVTVEGRVAGRIGPGLVVLLGVGRTDSDRDADWMADKVASLRIFADAAGQMNRSVAEAEGALLVVSQFTLFGDCRRGRRPSYVAAAEPEQARRLYLEVVDRLRRAGYTVETGEFGAMMDVELANDGPVTLLIDSERTF
ncbi:MAG: D-tyrosyl-tRNA(Tyr) deacylase [Acidobacteria bacterium]|nr:D-tyrosyl-tRNA(Tyr) deacylase [Acidobacteriota bacterium]MYD70846.1 D-tyrosyl-tRNA(Tyr) deacylase [Acidobacteriota bacterium]